MAGDHVGSSNLPTSRRGEPPDPGSSRQPRSQEQTFLAADRAWTERQRAAAPSGTPFAEKRPRPPVYLVRQQKISECDEDFGEVRQRHAHENRHAFDEASETWVPEGMFSGHQLFHVVADVSQNFRPVLSVHFDSESAEEFAALTGHHVGRRLVTVLDGKILDVSDIREESRGFYQVTGDFDSIDELELLIIVLRSGPLPVPVSILSEEVETHAKH